MNTTHTNEPTGQSAKQVAIQLGGEVLLRDYFAAKVMQGFAARDVFDNGLATPYQRARLAYIEADALLKAREQ